MTLGYETGIETVGGNSAAECWEAASEILARRGYAKWWTLATPDDGKKAG